ncbi:MAG: histidinol-phosphatase [Oscillospiraceae bacterium]|nr:histidinol-phosphatase [Oscillospiraceae bacterium]
MLANYHTHTSRCNHAVGEDRAYVESAIWGGMKVLGFSDHCPWLYPDGYVSATRMTPAQVDGYFTSLLRLKQEYASDITIYIGFESEYSPELLPAQEALLKDYPVDYQILGQHFIRPEPEGFYTGMPVHDEALLDAYISSLIEGMETGRYLYVAHPDLMGFTGSQAIYDKHYKRLCRYLKEHDIPVEINLLGVFEHRHYTNPHFLSLAAGIGCKAIIGCDAHQPERLCNPVAEKQCRRLAADAGLELIDYLPGFDSE